MAFIDYINTFIDFIYPRHCYSCDNVINNEHEIYLCDECQSQIRIGEKNRCARCGLALGTYQSVSNSGCISCKNVKLWFDAVYCIAEYDGVIRKLIHVFKYGRKEGLNIPLSNIIIEGFKGCCVIDDIDLVVPVPLFWKKRIKRSFNQSALIAKRLAKHYSIPISIGNLHRVRNTSAQTNLSREQRIDNVKDAFGIKKSSRFSGKSILLVDDVMTTGVTASECAYVLKKNGSKRVHVIILARAGMR